MELLPFVAVLAVMYFLLIRPQQKRQAEQSALLNNLKVGDDVVTIGGMYGTIVDLDDDTVDLQVDAAGQVLRFRRGAIASIVKDPDAETGDGETGDTDLPDDVAADGPDAQASADEVSRD